MNKSELYLVKAMACAIKGEQTPPPDCEIDLVPFFKKAVEHKIENIIYKEILRNKECFKNSDEVFENFAYYVDAVMPMGPKCFVVHLWTEEPYEPADREAAVKMTNQNIRRLAEYIDSKGAFLAVEVLPRTNMGNTVQECLQLIADTKAELCFDINHLMQGTHREFMELAGSHVKSLHLSDYEFGNEKHWIPGEGKIDWKELMQLLAQYNYDGPLMFEVTQRKDGGKLTLRDIRDGFFAAIK